MCLASGLHLHTMSAQYSYQNNVFYIFTKEHFGYKTRAVFRNDLDLPCQLSLHHSPFLSKKYISK
jgi:hypothetical protein